MLDLDKLEQELLDQLDIETNESLSAWLSEKRSKQQEMMKSILDNPITHLITEEKSN